MGALKLRQKVNFPATVTAEGGLGIDKVSGRWTISPKWDDLSLITSLPSPATKEVWARDPSTSSYYRISVQAFIDSLPQGPSGALSVGTTTTLPAGSSATVTNSGTSTNAVLNFGLPAGADGLTVRNGSGAPSSGLGNDGDFYIDTAASKIYGPKTSGAWGSGTSLIGPQGPTGVQGTPTTGHQVSWYNSTTIQDNGAMPASGMVKSDGTKLVAATAGTDFVAATSGSNIQKANGSGGLTAATAGTDYQAPIGTISGVAKGNGANALTAATAGTDYVAPGTATAFTKQQSFTLAILTDGATINWDVSGAQKAKVTLGGNRTMAAVTNAVEGTTYLLWVIQDATGSRTLTWTTTGAGSFDFGTGGTPTLTTTASKADLLAFEAISIGGTLKLRYSGIRLGFA